MAMLKKTFNCVRLKEKYMVNVETNLASAIMVAEGNKTKLDEYIKILLSDKQILAMIMKYALEEFREYPMPEVISRICDDVEVATVPLSPGQINMGKVRGTLTEDGVPNEGRIIYDIRFTAKYGDEYITILINIEAQRSTKKSKLGYHLDNRIIFYLARMISAQKQTEFFNSDYDSIKKVRSIWLCMDAEDDGDSINEIYMTQKCVFGKSEDFKNLDLMKAVVIHIRENENVDESKNELIAMLEDLLSKENGEIKKEKLKNKYGLIMTQELEGKVNVMCNWSEAIEERGQKMGIIKSKVELITKKIQKNKTPEQIADELEEELEDIKPVIEVVKKHAPEYNVDSIIKELRA
jgi:hypothetical protein